MARRGAPGFGVWLRERRGEIGLGLRSFAQQTRLDPGNLSKYERGVLPPPQDAETLRRIAKALKLKEGGTAYREFMDVAAVSAGRIPAGAGNVFRFGGRTFFEMNSSKATVS